VVACDENFVRIVQYWFPPGKTFIQKLEKFCTFRALLPHFCSDHGEIWQALHATFHFDRCSLTPFGAKNLQTAPWVILINGSFAV